MKTSKILSLLMAVILLLGVFSISAAAETTESAGIYQQLNLGDDLDMLFYVPADANTVINITVGEYKTAYDLSGETPDSNGHYVVTASLAAAQMTTDITLDFVQDGANVQKTYTVRDYALTILGGEYPALTKTLVQHMLNYGAAAQTYFEYKTDDLANSLLTAEQKAYATQNVAFSDQSFKDENGVGSSLVLKERIILTQYFQNITTDMYALVSFTDHKGNAHEIRVDGTDFIAKGNLYGVAVNNLVIADGDQLVTVTIYDAQGNVVTSAIDSINSYCARQQGNDELFELVAKFTTSAYAYFH